MKATETLTTAELKQEAKDVEDGLGEIGSYSKITEVKGSVQCENPLTSELAQKACVHYSMRIIRKWEERYWETDSQGNRIQKTRSGSDTVASNKQSIPFYINDSTGFIKINPEGAELITTKAYSQFKPGEMQGSSIQIGNFSLNLGNIASLGAGRRTIGYSYEEEIIPIGRDLYVLGEASDASGELTMQKPSEKGKKFIISTKSEEELGRGIQGSMTALMISSIISEIGGVILLVLRILGIIKD